MINIFKNFTKDESGAVTVDWVVLTAAVVGLAIAGYSAIETNTTTLTTSIGAKIGEQNTALNGTGT